MEYLGENLIHGIECSLDKLTSTEKEIAYYIMKHPDEISQMSISQIAKKLHISPATITRFCQKISFSGFNEFKHELKRYIDLKDRPAFSTDIKEIDHFAQLYQNHLSILDKTFQRVSYNEIQQAVALLTKAQKVHVYGIGNSGVAAQEFKSKFFRIGLNIETVTDPHEAVMDAALTTENDVVVGISVSGETREVIHAVHMAKKQGASVLIFTGDKNAKLAKLADITLLVMNKSNMHMGQNISPSLPLLLLFDLVYTELIAKDYTNRIKIRDKTLQALYDSYS